MRIRWRRRFPHHLEQPGDLLALHPSKIRLHREIHEVADGFHLETFWKTANGQQGPGATVYILAETVMCFDCLGHPLGHFHAYIGRSRLRSRDREDRIHFRETTIPEQVRRAAFELRWNLRYYQHRYEMSAVQRHPLDDAALANAADLLTQRLDYFCEAMPERFSGVVIDDRIYPSEVWARRGTAAAEPEKHYLPST